MTLLMNRQKKPFSPFLHGAVRLFKPIEGYTVYIGDNAVVACDVLNCDESRYLVIDSQNIWGNKAIATFVFETSPCWLHCYTIATRITMSLDV